MIAGTPQSMSPEQARGELIDHRSDLFSLGSVIYAMSTGHSPFRAETTFGILRRITDHTPRPVREVNAEIPTWLAQLLDRLLAKDPRERFQSAEDVAVLLEKCLAHVQQPTAIPLPAVLRKKRLSRAWALIPMIVTLLAGVSGGAFVLRHTEPPVSPPPNRPAELFLGSSKVSGANSQEADPADVEQNARPVSSSSAADLSDVRIT